MSKVTIVQFPSLDARQKWLTDHVPKEGIRVYPRNPWIAVQLTEDELKSLQQQPGIKLDSDPQGTPI